MFLLVHEKKNHGLGCLKFFIEKQDSEVRDLIFCHISEQAKVSYLVLVDGYHMNL